MAPSGRNLFQHHKEYNMQRISRSLVASLIVATAALAGCGGGGGDGDSSGGGSGNGLVGVWKTDVGAIVTENDLLILAVGEGVCTGPVELELKADGTFFHRLDATCRFPAGAAVSTRTRITGDYSVSGSRITVSNAVQSVSGSSTIPRCARCGAHGRPANAADRSSPPPAGPRCGCHALPGRS